MSDLNDRRILITGAAGGIGSQLSVHLAGLGANLILLDKDSKALIRLYDQIQSLDDSRAPLAVPLDLLNAGDAEFDVIAREIQNQVGNLDCLIHAASLFHKLAPIDDLQLESLLDQFRVNCASILALIRACFPMLKDSKNGRVLILSEEHAFEKGKAYWTSFAVANAGLKVLVDCLSDEWERFENLTINILIPKVASPQRSRTHPAENQNSLMTMVDLLPVVEKILEESSFKGRVITSSLN